MEKRLKVRWGSVVGDRKAQEEFLERIGAADVLDGTLSAECGCSGDDHLGARRVEAGQEGDDGVILREWNVGGARKIGGLFAGLGVEVANAEIAFAGAVGDTLKDELAGAWNFEKGQIFGGRTDEDQVAVLGVVERKEAAALDAKGVMQGTEELVQGVDGEDFADASVVIPDGVWAVLRWVEVTHAGFRAAEEGGVAEDDPGLVGALEEGTPKISHGGGRGLFWNGEGAGNGCSRKEKSKERGGKENRKGYQSDEKTALRWKSRRRVQGRGVGRLVGDTITVGGEGLVGVVFVKGQ